MKLLARAEVFDMFRGKKQILRDVCVQLADTFRTGGAMHQVLGWTAVPNKKSRPAETIAADTNRERWMRSDHLAACQRVLLEIIMRTDIVTSDICRDWDKQHYGWRVDSMAEDLGICQRRVERVIRVLRNAGILQTWERAEALPDGRYKGHVAIRKVNMTQLVALVGLGKRWMEKQAAEVKERAAKLAGRVRSAQELARDALRQQGLQRAQARSMREVLAEGFRRAGAPPGPSLGPPLKAR